jgi:predicted XRE-type DNA-binding protein
MRFYAVYVLHTFQKKSKRGISTPKKGNRSDSAETGRRRTGLPGKAELKMKTKPPRKNTPRITESSGNVFADLGFANPEQELMKARLTLQIYHIIQQRGLTQTEAAKTLGIQQPHVSLLMRNRAGSFSVGRLMEFLTALGQDVEITVRPTRKEHGEMSVMIR